MLTNITKMSTIDHFANVSSHRKVEPRLDIDSLVGGTNQQTREINCFVYGQIPEKTRMKTAISVAPASHISTVDFIMEN